MTVDQQTTAKVRLAAAMAVFGTIGLFVRYIPLPSSVIALVRGAVGAIFLLLVGAAKNTPPDWKAIRRNLRYLLPCGMMMGFNWIMLFEAYRYTTVAVATLCYYLAPVIILLLSPIVLREKLTTLKACCIAAALVGMFLVSGIVQSGDLSAFNFRGIGLGTAAAVLYAMIVLLNKKMQGISANDTTMTELGISAIMMLLYNLLTVDISTLSCPPSGLILLLIVGVFHTGFCYTLYFGCISALPAQTSALFSYIDPVVAILLSALVLHEPMDLLCIIGAVLILGSTLVGELFEKKA